MLMRTDPFRELDRVAQQVVGTTARPATMPIDAYRKGDEFVALFDLPGLDPDSIALTVERNVLTVHAERHRSSADDVELLIGERPHGTFSRQLFLTETLDTDRIVAEYTDGVLQLRIPVKERAKPRRVDIGAQGPASTSIEANSVDNGGPQTCRGRRNVRPTVGAPRQARAEHAARWICPMTWPRSSRSVRPPRCWTCNQRSSVASTRKAW